jgi:arylsulfatase
MKRISLYLISLVLVAGCAEQEAPNVEMEKKDGRPNILLILADDLGYSDIGPFGGEISTPNLDALAADGLKMGNLYAASACSPTRSMLLSGTTSHKAGMGTMYNDQTPEQLGQPGYEGFMNKDVISISTLLRDAGYHTYMTGKWHLGYEDDQSANARGFEKSFALLQGGGHHFDDKPMTVDHDTSWYRENGKRVDLPDDFFSSEFYTDKIINYIDSDKKDGKPFFAYLAYTAPHWPLQAPIEYIDKYKGKYNAGYNDLTEKRLSALKELGLTNADTKAPKPVYPENENWDNLSDEQKKIDVREMEIYAAMVDNMDYHIGRILSYLEETGERDNTIIIFMSDNGAAGFGPGMNKAFPQEWIDGQFDNSYENMGKENSYIYYGPHWAQAGTAPSRIFKGFSTEGGLKVPGIINFRGKSDALKGQLSHQFMTVLDLAPTFMDLADAEPFESPYNGKEVHRHIGTSIMPYLRGEINKIHDEEEAVVWELHGRIAVRKGDWKLIKLPANFGTGDWELFNVRNDPGETMELSNDMPDKLQELKQEWQQYLENNGVILPSD